MSRNNQRPRQIDINKPLIKYENWEEFQKIDTTIVDNTDTQIVMEKIVSTNGNENPTNVFLKRKESNIKEKKAEILINKPEILIPVVKKMEDEIQ